MIHGRCFLEIANPFPIGRNMFKVSNKYSRFSECVQVKQYDWIMVPVVFFVAPVPLQFEGHMKLQLLVCLSPYLSVCNFFSNWFIRFGKFAK